MLVDPFRDTMIRKGSRTAQDRLEMWHPRPRKRAWEALSHAKMLGAAQSWF
jgi:hypothetical protein